jgi:hypothetical protein
MGFGQGWSVAHTDYPSSFATEPGANASTYIAAYACVWVGFGFAPRSQLKVA